MRMKRILDTGLLGSHEAPILAQKQSTLDDSLLIRRLEPEQLQMAGIIQDATKFRKRINVMTTSQK
jgi:hypothetical protein